VRRNCLRELAPVLVLLTHATIVALLPGIAPPFAVRIRRRFTHTRHSPVPITPHVLPANHEKPATGYTTKCTQRTKLVDGRCTFARLRGCIVGYIANCEDGEKSN
jgi:hypothetical protein